MTKLAEYIWIDGSRPTPQLRSKTKVLDSNPLTEKKLPDTWSFDGSSTCQAPGDDSDRFLKPVRVVRDPTRSDTDVLVLCEVLNPDDTPHESNKRAALRQLLDEGACELNSLWGFEQEYVMTKNDAPLGWPDSGYPLPQGPYYCAVGNDNIAGRTIAEKHLKGCLDIGLLAYGINAEVMLGQWEFQIGHRNWDWDRNGAKADPLTTADHLWLARWLLYRIAEQDGVGISLEPKPVTGDWNGSGCHTNFSTAKMRDSQTGRAEIGRILNLFEEFHTSHQAVYGAGNRKRLTGLHETCRWDEFRSGTADRGASIRIPAHVAQAGYGYLEDRRPAANIDPYVVAHRILKTISK